jgi:hypothetical protein
MITFRRFVVVQLLLLWQGGFLFYASCVVPAGTDVLGKAGQGAITARVTDALNAIGLVGVGILALELSLTRDPNPLRPARRWWAWGVAMLCQFFLLYLHMLLDAFMDPDRKRVVIGPPFYPVHRMYLWTSTIQWLACLLWMWWTVNAWRDEDLANRQRERQG